MAARNPFPQRGGEAIRRPRTVSAPTLGLRDRLQIERALPSPNVAAATDFDSAAVALRPRPQPVIAADSAVAVNCVYIGLKCKPNLNLRRIAEPIKKRGEEGVVGGATPRGVQ